MISKLALLFVSQFVLIFLLGFQQINVHGDYRVRAVTTSLAIGACQLVAMYLIPRATTPAEFATFLLAGPLGIWAVMKFVRNKK